MLNPNTAYCWSSFDRACRRQIDQLYEQVPLAKKRLYGTSTFILDSQMCFIGFIYVTMFVWNSVAPEFDGWFNFLKI